MAAGVNGVASFRGPAVMTKRPGDHFGLPSPFPSLGRAGLFFEVVMDTEVTSKVWAKTKVGMFGLGYHPAKIAYLHQHDPGWADLFERLWGRVENPTSEEDQRAAAGELLRWASGFKERKVRSEGAPMIEKTAGRPNLAPFTSDEGSP